MNTVNSDVITFAQFIGCGEFGTDLFYGHAPSSLKTPTSIWLLTNTTSSLDTHNVTGEDSLVYSYMITYRSTNAKDVDREIFRITKEIVGSHCYNLDNFKTMDVAFVSAGQPYIDEENRTYNSVSFNVRVYDILSEDIDNSASD